VFANQPKPPCQPIAKIEKDFTKALGNDKASFTRFTPGQFHFLQGVYALSPDTPPGLPPAEYAMLAKGDREDNGAILFIKGKMVCYAMAAPKQLLELTEKVLTDRLDAEGDEM